MNETEIATWRYNDMQRRVHLYIDKACRRTRITVFNVHSGRCAAYDFIANGYIARNASKKDATDEWNELSRLMIDFFFPSLSNFFFSSLEEVQSAFGSDGRLQLRASASMRARSA